MNKKQILFLGFFGIVVLAMVVLSTGFASAYMNSIEIAINATNGASGSTWFQAGSNQSINFTITPTPFNDSTNLTQLNFSSTNFTFWGGGLLGVNNSEWSCTRWSASLVNCSGGTSVNAILNITLNLTMNSTTYAYEMNHSINVSMLTNGTATINYTNFNIELDGIVPTITLPAYTNATFKKNTDQLTLAIYVNDSGAGGSSCYVNINGTNQTFTVSSGICSFTVGNLTALGDANATIRVYANDSVNNLNLNNSFVVQVDTTAPTMSFSCSPATVTQNTATTCTCSGTDATSGFNSSTLSYTASPSTANTGTYTLTCSGNDYCGNSVSSQTIYYVQGASNNGDSPGGSTTTTTWTSTQSIGEETFENGYTSEITAKKRIKVKVENDYHYVGVVSLTATQATISITSDPVQVVLDVGEDAKVDVTDDGFYDIYVVLNSIANNKANVTMQKIYEEISAEEEGPITTTGEIEDVDSGVGNGTDGASLTWLWILIVAVVIIVIIGGGIAIKKRK